MTASRAKFFDIVRGFVIDEQPVTSGPNGITIEPLCRPGFAALGGGWRVQFGSGIAGHDDAAAVVRVGVGDPMILGPYVTTKKGLIAQLRLCPGVVCRRCQGYSADSGQPRWVAAADCHVCSGYGVYGFTFRCCGGNDERPQQHCMDCPRYGVRMRCRDETRRRRASNRR
jgi:hypothetical protein